MVRPLNVCSGCSEPMAAPRSASGLRTSLPRAPLVCRTIFPRQAPLPDFFLPCRARLAPERWYLSLRRATERGPAPIRARASAVSAIARSGVAIRIRSAASTASDKPACGLPLPIRRRAARAVRIERVITGPMRQPFSRKRLPSAHPTRPAPTIATTGLTTAACDAIAWIRVSAQLAALRFRGRRLYRRRRSGLGLP